MENDDLNKDFIRLKESYKSICRNMNLYNFSEQTIDQILIFKSVIKQSADTFKNCKYD